MLPPSSGWIEATDPLPAPSGRETTRFFRKKGNEAIGLRVVMETHRLDYLPAVIAQMAQRLHAQATQGGLPVKVLDATSITVEGVPVARLLSTDGETKTLSYHLPGDEGDRMVSLIATEWDHETEQEVTNLVMAATGLRRPTATTGSFDWGIALFGVMGLTFLIGMGALGWMVIRRRPVS